MSTTSWWSRESIGKRWIPALRSWLKCAVKWRASSTWSASPCLIHTSIYCYGVPLLSFSPGFIAAIIVGCATPDAGLYTGSCITNSDFFSVYLFLSVFMPKQCLTVPAIKCLWILSEVVLEYKPGKSF